MLTCLGLSSHVFAIGIEKYPCLALQPKEEEKNTEHPKATSSLELPQLIHRHMRNKFLSLHASEISMIVHVRLLIFQASQESFQGFYMY